MLPWINDRLLLSEGSSISPVPASQPDMSIVRDTSVLVVCFAAVEQPENVRMREFRRDLELTLNRIAVLECSLQSVQYVSHKLRPLFRIQSL